MKRINKYIAMLSAAIVTACALPVSVFAAKISTSVLQITTTLESYGAYLEANKLGNSKAGLRIQKLIRFKKSWQTAAAALLFQRGKQQSLL